MWRRISALALALLLWNTNLAAAAAPQSITRDDQKDVMVTIYNGNLGLVKDTREIRLDAGMLEVQFGDVAAQIDPTSVHLKSLTDPAGLKILEQNYEYDLLTSAKLMEKYVGKKVRLYQSNGTYQDATLLSTNGPVYEINGQIHMGHYGQVVLPALPENLVSKPTLVWLLRNARAAAQRVEASYLTGGITWKADYVMVFNQTAPIRTRRSSAPTGPSTRSMARSTWGTMARLSSPPCLRTWSPSPRSSGCSATRGRPPSASRRLT